MTKRKLKATAAFRSQPTRQAVFAGKSYEADRHTLQQQITGFFESKEAPEQKPSDNQGKKIKAIVVPTFEPKEAGPLYAWAYKELKEAATPDVFILIGTCHAGLERGIAMTDRDFETPLGIVPVNKPIIEQFRKNGGEVFFEEDIQHRHEHSIEFQLPFLQHTVGSQKPITIVPVLCSFSPSVLADPEEKPLFDQIDIFLSKLKEAINALRIKKCVSLLVLTWRILGFGTAIKNLQQIFLFIGVCRPI